jgi:putative nucleotidyltransferase with HDIG domain
MNFSPTYSSDLKRGIPSREECLALMEDQGMLPNIRSHSLQVARVAQVLAVHLPASRPPLDLALLEAGALLHDIAKTECLKTKKRHTDIGGALLEARGYPEVAEIVAQHVTLNHGHSRPDRISEVELVHYADKRVLHEEIVDLQTRFEYLQSQYGRTSEDRKRIAALLENSLNQEKKIFRDLPFSPSELKSRVDHPAG